ncbi:MAG TPA: helix-turn-helix domain-containing protein [Patescibacteria group bacterium]
MFEMLVKLGLSEKEAKVYLATLELGTDTAQNIALKADVNRATTYVTLEKLMNQGLVTTSEEGKKTVFTASDPHELTHYLEEQKREIESKKQYLDGAISQLMAVYNAKSGKPTVRFYQGGEGIAALNATSPEAGVFTDELLLIIPVNILELSRRPSVLSSLFSGTPSLRYLCSSPSGEVSEATRQLLPANGLIVSDDILSFEGLLVIYPGWGVKWYAFETHPYGMLLQSADFAQNMKSLFELAWAGSTAYSQQLMGSQT